MPLTTLIPILGFALAIHHWGGRTISSSVLISITGIITLLYIFGLVGLLQGAAWLLFYLGFMFALYLFYRHREQTRKALLSVPILIFITGSICHWLLFYEAHYFYIDTYGYWGRVSFELIRTHHYGSGNLPGAAVWHYFTTLHSGFSEGGTIFGHFLLLFGSTLSLYERLTYRQPQWILAALLLNLSVFAYLGHGFSALFTDHLVSAIFSGIVLALFSQRHSSKEFYWYIFPLCALLLVKYIGLAFAFAAIGLVALLCIEEITQKRMLPTRLWIRESRGHMIMIGVLMIAPLLTYQSWSWYHEKASSSAYTRLAENVVSGKKYLSQEERKEFQSRFIETFLEQPVGRFERSYILNEFNYNDDKRFYDDSRLSAFEVLGISLLALVIAFFSSPKGEVRRRVGTAFVFVVILAVSYNLFFYISYPLLRPHLALELRSYIRWINIGLFPVLLIPFSLFLPYVHRGTLADSARHSNGTVINSGNQFALLVLLLGALIVVDRPFYPELYTPNPPSSSNTPRFRQVAEQGAQIVKQHITQGATTIAVIDPDNIFKSNMRSRIYGFLLLPHRASAHPRSTLNEMSDDELHTYFAGYDYIWYIKYPDSKGFDDRVHNLLGGQEGPIKTLYQVDKSGGKLKFLAVY